MAFELLIIAERREVLRQMTTTKSSLYSLFTTTAIVFRFADNMVTNVLVTVWRHNDEAGRVRGHPTYDVHTKTGFLHSPPLEIRDGKKSCT